MPKMKDRTRIMFAEELEEMLKTTELDKIRVSTLCKRCGTTTPTFYYYFHDKYELVAWIYLNDFLTQTGGRQQEYSAYTLIAMNSQLNTHKAFYKRAFDDRSQNSIEKYMFQFSMKLSADAYAAANDGQSLTKEQLTAVRYHAYGIIGLFKDWIFDRNDLTSEEMSQFLFSKTPDFLKEAFSKYDYPSDKISAI